MVTCVTASLLHEEVKINNTKTPLNSELRVSKGEMNLEFQKEKLVGSINPKANILQWRKAVNNFLES